MTFSELISFLAASTTFIVGTHKFAIAYRNKIKSEWAKHSVRIADKLMPIESYASLSLVWFTMIFTLSGIALYFATGIEHVSIFEMSTSNIQSSIFTTLQAVSLIPIMMSMFVMMFLSPAFNRSHEWPIRIGKRLK